MWYHLHSAWWRLRTGLHNTLLIHIPKKITQVSTEITEPSCNSLFTWQTRYDHEVLYTYTPKEPTQTLEANSGSRQQSTGWARSSDPSSPWEKGSVEDPWGCRALAPSFPQPSSGGRGAGRSNALVLLRGSQMLQAQLQSGKIRQRKGRERISLPSTRGGQRPQLKGTRADSLSHLFQYRNIKMSKWWTMQKKDGQPVAFTRGGGKDAGQGGQRNEPWRMGKRGNKPCKHIFCYQTAVNKRR